MVLFALNVKLTAVSSANDMISLKKEIVRPPFIIPALSSMSRNYKNGL